MLLLPLFLAWVAGFAVIVVAARQSVLSDFPDPRDITRSAPYAATLSVMGVFGWAIAVTSAGWCAHLAGIGGRKSARVFLSTGAGVAGLLLAENLLAFHPASLKEWGLPHVYLQIAACIVTGIWLRVFRHEIVRTRMHVLGAAVATQLMSLLITPMGDGRTPWGILYEDGVRILGIAAWIAYIVSTSGDISRSILRVHMAASGLEEQAAPARNRLRGLRARSAT